MVLPSGSPSPCDRRESLWDGRGLGGGVKVKSLQELPPLPWPLPQGEGN